MKQGREVGKSVGVEGEEEQWYGFLFLIRVNNKH